MSELRDEFLSEEDRYTYSHGVFTHEPHAGATEDPASGNENAGADVTNQR